ncbi:MAG: hypothetical protein L6W00_19730 [Lentisphaeria bacterium]|nr:MAG: hypothetical protein L6W00_19730 [Lentisphaeria bacterium]
MGQLFHLRNDPLCRRIVFHTSTVEAAEEIEDSGIVVKVGVIERDVGNPRVDQVVPHRPVSVQIGVDEHEIRFQGENLLQIQRTEYADARQIPRLFRERLLTADRGNPDCRAARRKPGIGERGVADDGPAGMLRQQCFGAVHLPVADGFGILRNDAGLRPCKRGKQEKCRKQKGTFSLAHCASRSVFIGV